MSKPGIKALFNRLGSQAEEMLYGREMAAIRWHQDRIDEIKARREAGDPAGAEAEAMAVYLACRRGLK